MIQNIRLEAVLCPGFFAGRHWTNSERLVTVAGESQIGSIGRDAARRARTFNIAQKKAAS